MESIHVSSHRGRVFCTDPRIHGAVLRGEPSEDVHGHGEQPLERRDLRAAHHTARFIMIICQFKGDTTVE